MSNVEIRIPPRTQPVRQHVHPHMQNVNNGYPQHQGSDLKTFFFSLIVRNKYVMNPEVHGKQAFAMLNIYSQMFTLENKFNQRVFPFNRESSIALLEDISQGKLTMRVLTELMALMQGKTAPSLCYQGKVILQVNDCMTRNSALSQTHRQKKRKRSSNDTDVIVLEPEGSNILEYLRKKYPQERFKDIVKTEQEILQEMYPALCLGKRVDTGRHNDMKNVYQYSNLIQYENKKYCFRRRKRRKFVHKEIGDKPSKFAFRGISQHKYCTKPFVGTGRFIYPGRPNNVALFNKEYKPRRSKVSIEKNKNMTKKYLPQMQGPLEKVRQPTDLMNMNVPGKKQQGVLNMQYESVDTQSKGRRVWTVESRPKTRVTPMVKTNPDSEVADIMQAVKPPLKYQTVFREYPSFGGHHPDGVYLQGRGGRPREVGIVHENIQSRDMYIERLRDVFSTRNISGKMSVLPKKKNEEAKKIVGRKGFIPPKGVISHPPTMAQVDKNDLFKGPQKPTNVVPLIPDLKLSTGDPSLKFFPQMVVSNPPTVPIRWTGTQTTVPGIPSIPGMRSLMGHSQNVKRLAAPNGVNTIGRAATRTRHQVAARPGQRPPPRAPTRAPPRAPPRAAAQRQNPRVAAQRQNPRVAAQRQNPRTATQRQNPIVTAQRQNPRTVAQMQNPRVPARTAVRPRTAQGKNGVRQVVGNIQKQELTMRKRN